MERTFDWKKRFLQIHKPNRLDPQVLSAFAGTVVTDGWKVVISPEAGAVLQNVARDLVEYFFVSMGRSLSLDLNNDSGVNTIFVSVDPALGNGNFSIQVLSDRILIFGADERLAAQGCYTLEDEMNMNCAPAICEGVINKHLLYRTRIIHGGLEFNEYPDELLRLLAHSGINCIRIDIKEASEDPVKREQINDLMLRAKSFGLDTACYVPYTFRNLVHPEDPGAFAYYEEKYGTLVEQIPHMSTLWICGECCEFPSKDERTTGKSWRDSMDDPRYSPGWFPCRDYPQFVSMLRDVIKKHNPNVELVFETYNFGWAEESLRTQMIRGVPTDIPMAAAFEMFHKEEVAPGVYEESTDYTLWNIGPGNYFASESRLHREMGRPMYAITNSGGNTWDTGVVPFIPAPQRWIQRWQAIEHCRKTMRIDALEEAHTYGFWPGFISEMAKQITMEPIPDMDALLRKIIARDFGKDNVKPVYEAYGLFSQAMSHCVPTCVDQYGPARVGPVYPLIYKIPVEMPQAPEGSGDPNYESNPIYKFNPDHMVRLCYEAKEYEKMARLYDAGCEILEQVIETLPENKKENARDILGVARMICATARTVFHVKCFHEQKCKLGVYLDTIAIWAGGRKNQPEAVPFTKMLTSEGNPTEALLALIQIAEAEIRNVEQIIPYIRRDSRLGYEQEYGYTCTEEQLRWKIAHTRQVIQEELLPALEETFAYVK
jgi:hypothetical protein